VISLASKALKKQRATDKTGGRFTRQGDGSSVLLDKHSNIFEGTRYKIE
jgi:hypothetical protein